ncbi:MAG: type II toxin-antitoxin system VapC family toxin [Chitinophagales bacterium]
MKTVFIDTNVLLDIFLNRMPFRLDAVDIFREAEEETIEVFTSSISIANIAYGIQKHVGKSQVRPALSKIMSITQIVETDRSAILSAIASGFSDIEDAFQHYSALKIPGIDFIITRNTSDYKHSLIPVISPKEFLRHLKNTES